MSRLKPEFNVKMIVIGDVGVGKTHLVRCYDDKVNAILQEPCSVDIDLIRKTIVLPDCKINLIVWDTIGSDRFQMLNRKFYKGALGALICFDLSMKVEEERMLRWAKEVKKYTAEGCCVAIVGTKSDKIEYPEYNETSKILKEYALKNNFLYFETSVLKPDTIFLSIEELIEDVKVKHLDPLILNPSTSHLSFLEQTTEHGIMTENGSCFEMRFEIEKSTTIGRVRLSNQTVSSKKAKKNKSCSCT